MKTKQIILFTAAMAFLSCTGRPADDSIVINVSQEGADVPASMYGIFFEEINHAGDGGLIAELVENGTFEELEMPAGYHAEGDRLITSVDFHHSKKENVQGSYRWTDEPVPGWTLSGDAQMVLTKESPMFKTAPTNLKVTVGSGSAVLENDGYWGMNIEEGKKYDLRTIIKGHPSFKGSISAKIVSGAGEILAESPVDFSGNGEWVDGSIVLTASASCDSASIRFEIDGAGCVSFDYVSLLPEDRYECEGGKLPFRKDVAQMLADLRPAFIRWPGGCVVEGISLANRFEWKKTLGDPAARPGEYSTWGYRCSYKLGFHEMLSFCESIGAASMFVCNVGIGCQYRQGDLCAEKDIQYYLDDCLDAIEYALGPVDSEWGAKRAAAGHPEAFPLEYVEIGNENWGPDYERHYNIFHKAIKERYPQLTLICNCGLSGTGSIDETDMIDPHWYVKPDFFFNNTEMFDKVERGKYTAYVGEYAANSGVGAGNMKAALSEAAWISGMERNSDFVRMCSYAPLFENSNDRVWPVNLIWINSSQVVGRSSYYVQKMAAENRPDFNVACSKYKGDNRAISFGTGRIGLGSCETAVEFKDITICGKDGNRRIVNPESFKARKGTWKCEDGILSQSCLKDKTLAVLEDFSADEYSICLKFRRTAGPEGFYLYFGLDEEGGSGWLWSVGGWDDTITGVEPVGSNLSESDGVAKAERSVVKDGIWQEARIEVGPGSSTLYIDGEKILECHPETPAYTYFSSGIDKENSEVVIKVVNANTESLHLGITLEGVTGVSRSGKVIELKSDSLQDENSFDDPMKIYPEEKKINGFGKNFTYDFAPCSYTVLRIPVK